MNAMIIMHTTTTDSIVYTPSGFRDEPVRKRLTNSDAEFIAKKNQQGTMSDIIYTQSKYNPKLQPCHQPCFVTFWEYANYNSFADYIKTILFISFKLCKLLYSNFRRESNKVSPPSSPSCSSTQNFRRSGDSE